MEEITHFYHESLKNSQKSVYSVILRNLEMFIIPLKQYSIKLLKEKYIFSVTNLTFSNELCEVKLYKIS